MQPIARPRTTALQAFRDGNFKDAYDGLRRLLTVAGRQHRRRSTRISPPRSNALQQLNRVDEIDALLEQTVAAHAKSWQVARRRRQPVQLDRALRLHDRRRVPPRSASRRRSRRPRHRPRPRPRTAALSPRRRARRRLARTKPTPRRVLRGLAQTLAYNGDTSQYWRLQSLTDLATLPDYEEGWGYNYGGPQGAPVDADGNPIFYDLARQLGRRQERRRALAVGAGRRWSTGTRARRADELIARAAFLAAQFDVQTMAGQPIPLFRAPTDGDAKDSAANLGPRHARRRRNHRPPRHRHQAIQAAGRPELHQALPASARPRAARRRSSPSAPPSRSSATIFENRRQYRPRRRVLATWRSNASPATNGRSTKHRLDQIIGNWGEFGSVAHAARRPRRHDRLPLPQRQAGRVHRPAGRRRQTARRRQGLPQLAAQAARLATS